jgi:hypothetical protein
LMAGLLKVMAHRLRHANRSIAHLAGKLHEAQANASGFEHHPPDHPAPPLQTKQQQQTAIDSVA